MQEEDYKIISEVMAKYGYPEYTIIGFTEAREYNLFSYFSSPANIEDFRKILIQMVATIDRMNDNIPPKGNC